MAKPDLEQSLGQGSQSQRARRIPLHGVGIDPEGVVKFAGEAGGPPGSIQLSGEQLRAHEIAEAMVINDLYNFFRNQPGVSDAEARQMAGIG